MSGSRRRVAIIPGTLALRPEYASVEDPIPELRKAVTEAAEWLGSGLLVVANGSAKRTEKAPGHFDERAEAFDEALGAALRAGDLSGVDLSLAEELWADVGGLAPLAGVRATEVQVDYDDAPYGVQYWVVRWEIGAG